MTATIASTHDRMTLLQELVHDDQGFKGLDLVGQDGQRSKSVPDGQGRVVVPRVDDHF